MKMAMTAMMGLVSRGWLLFLGLLMSFSLLALASPLFAGAMCSTSTPSGGTYSVTVCVTVPAEGASLSGVEAVTATASVSGTGSSVRRMVFYLDGAYLLSDHTEPYTFELPSDHFVDGGHSLAVEALMHDDYVSDQASIGVSFNNGVTSPPVNPNSFTPHTGTPPPAGQSFVLTAAGDGAGGGDNVEAVTDLVVAQESDMFLYLGDVYEKGTYTEFYNWYGTSERFYGRFRDITNPVIGNHEYNNGVAPGYFFYWDNIQNYYSYDAAGWHFIALDSTGVFGETEPGEPQYEWLVQDLNDNTAQCTVVYFHHPVYSVGPQGDTERMNEMWSLMAQAGVDLVLTGHDHSYQRWEPLDGDGNPAAQGITQFVQGAGGHGVQDFVRADSRLVIGFGGDSPTAEGVLRLDLNPDGAAFRYVNIDNQLLDSGVVPCSGAASDTIAPTSPPNLVSQSAAGSTVELSWEAAYDNTGVAGYTIYRNGVVLTTVNGATLSYTDSDVTFNASYSYQVDAFDLAGNHSSLSNSVEVSTSDMLLLMPLADAYVRASVPDDNHGAEIRLRTDGSPETISYLRFDIPDLAGQMVMGTLRIYANSFGDEGYSLHGIADNSWDEFSITYNNRPALGSLVDSLPPFAAETWTEVDVTSLISGEGLLSVAITSSSNSNTDYASREGLNPPQLLLKSVDSITLTPLADTYIKADAPDSSFGSQSQLRTDGQPEIISFLRFDVPDAPSLPSATLRIYANSFGDEGIDFHSVADNSWDEAMTYNNAPAVGAIVGSVGAFSSNSWIEVDVTALITGEGLLSLALSSTSPTNTSYSSREGANPPELILHQGNSGGGALLQEAEDALLSGEFVIGNDGAASGGQYIHVPNGGSNSFNGPNPAHQAEYSFSVTTAGTYRIKGWAYAETGQDNSFYLQVDGSPSNGYLWEFPKNTSYQLDYVSNRNGADPVEVSLSAGEHTLALFLRENGARLDKLELELVDNTPPPPPPPCGGLLVEGEVGVITGDFVIANDTSASGGQYLHVPDGAGNSFNAPNPAHQAQYCFNVPTAGTYRIKGAVYAATGQDNSFFVQVDGNPSSGYLWDFPKNTAYELDYVSDRNGNDPVEVSLSAGEHTITIFLREDGARLDKLELEEVPGGEPPFEMPPTAIGIAGTLLINHDSIPENQADLDLSVITLILRDVQHEGATYQEETHATQLGDYYFDQMPQGDYLLTLNLPLGYSSSQPTEVKITATAEEMVEHTFELDITGIRQIYLPVITR